MNRHVNVLDENNIMRRFPFMTALNQTFTDLRFYSGGFWNRVYFPLAALLLTREARRLKYNVGVLRKTIDCVMACPEKHTVAESVQKNNDDLGIPYDMTRDDLVTQAATIAGLDTVAVTIMATLWHLLQDGNIGWREKVTAEIATVCLKFSIQFHLFRFEHPDQLFPVPLTKLPTMLRLCYSHIASGQSHPRQLVQQASQVY